MNVYLTKLLTAHPYIYGITEYGTGVTRKITVLTIENVDNLGPVITDISNQVGKVCKLRTNKRGQILFKNGSIEDIAYWIEKEMGVKVTPKRV